MGASLPARPRRRAAAAPDRGRRPAAGRALPQPPRGRFWRRIADDHRAKFVIVDFKNYTDPIDAGIVDDVSRYANKALGDFIVVVSREGADRSADKARRRAYRDRDVILLVVSDAQLLEMLARKAGGEAPEDLLDEFLIAY